MESKDFPKANVAIAKGQTEYKTLYGFVDKFQQPHEATVCFKLSQEEIEQITKTGEVWLTQLTFGKGYSPIRMSFLSPFTEEESRTDIKPADENRVSAEEWDRTHFMSPDKTLGPEHIAYYTVPCANCSKPETEHYWSTRQCSL